MRSLDSTPDSPSVSNIPSVPTPSPTDRDFDSPQTMAQDNPDVPNTNQTHHNNPDTSTGAPTGAPAPESITVEAPGGIRVKLPTLVLVHLLSLAGVAGGTYTLNKPDADQTKSDIAAIAQRMERIERDRNAVVERLARIETLAENIREDLRDQRGYGRQLPPARRQPQPVNPAEQP